MIRRTAAETVTCFLLSLFITFFSFSFLFEMFYLFFGNQPEPLFLGGFGFGLVCFVFFFFLLQEERKPMTVCQALTIEHARTTEHLDFVHLLRSFFLGNLVDSFLL